MSRIAFWVINVTGLFLILNRSPDEESNTRVIIGGTLMAIGTIGILAKDLMRKKKAPEE